MVFERKLQLTGLALAVLAVAYSRTAMSYGVTFSGGTVGPGSLPLLLGGLLLLLSILLVVTAGQNPTTDDQDAKERRREFVSSAQFFVALVGYVVLVMLVGFLIATLASVAGILVIVFNYSYRRASLYAIGMTLLCYVVFVLVLRVRLP